MMNMQNMNMKKAQKGFTLIELMIVVAIIGILASIAIPAYQGYITKAKFQDIVSGAAAVETAVAMCLQENAGLASACDSAGELIGINIVASKEATAAYAIAASGSGVSVSATAKPSAGSYTYINTAVSTTGDTQVVWTQTGSCEAAGMCKE